MEKSPLYTRCWHSTLDLDSRPLGVRKGESTWAGINKSTQSFPTIASSSPAPEQPPGCTRRLNAIYTKDAFSRLLLFSHPQHHMLPFTPIKISFSLRPMKTVEQADRQMQHAKVLYEHYEHFMKPTDRTLAKDKMIFATDVRHGVEEKLWLARARQANLYSDRAQKALKTIKRLVDEAIEIRGRKDGELVP